VKKAFHQIELDKYDRDFLLDGFGWKTPTILNQNLSLTRIKINTELTGVGIKAWIQYIGRTGKLGLPAALGQADTGHPCSLYLNTCPAWLDLQDHQPTVPGIATNGALMSWKQFPESGLKIRTAERKGDKGYHKNKRWAARNRNVKGEKV
jgi:hypothetical protein